LFDNGVCQHQVGVSFFNPFDCATPFTDFIPKSGVLIFAPGQTFAPIVVPALRDNNNAETNEVFLGILTVPENALIDPLNQAGVGKITNQVPPANVTMPECTVEYTNGFVGHPGGMTLGPDKNLWMTEQQDKKLVSFDPTALKATEYNVNSSTVITTHPH